VLNALRRAVAAVPESELEARAAANLDLANMLDDLGRHLLAMEHYGEALRLYTAAGADHHVAVVADNMSMSYERVGHLRNALHYALQAFAGYQRDPEQAGALLQDVFWRIDRLGVHAMVDGLGVEGVTALARAFLPARQRDEGNQ
jgi:tetratricopeptide (TPR) repeat protein